MIQRTFGLTTGFILRVDIMFYISNYLKKQTWIQQLRGVTYLHELLGEGIGEYMQPLSIGREGVICDHKEETALSFIWWNPFSIKYQSFILHLSQNIKITLYFLPWIQTGKKSPALEQWLEVKLANSTQIMEKVSVSVFLIKTKAKNYLKFHFIWVPRICTPRNLS